MKFLAVAALLVALAQAAPAPELEVRAGYDIQWCKNKNYKGSCKKYDDLDSGKCYDMPSDYNNECSSVKKSRSYKCRYYKKKDCDGSYMTANGDYEELPDGYDDAISSWKCSS